MYFILLHCCVEPIQEKRAEINLEHNERNSNNVPVYAVHVLMEMELSHSQIHIHNSEM